MLRKFFTPPESKFFDRQVAIEEQVQLREKITSKFNEFATFEEKIAFLKDSLSIFRNNIPSDLYRDFHRYLNMIEPVITTDELVSKILPYVRIIQEVSSFGKPIPANDLLCYTFSGTDLQLHIAPYSGTENKLVLFHAGLKTVAKAVESNKKIKRITGNSWIVYKYPKILERYGFDVSDFKNEKTNEWHRGKCFGEWITNEKISAKAVISREDFLKRYS